MFLRKLVGLMACTLVLSFAFTAMAGVPDLALSSASAENAGVLTLYVLPGGNGNSFELARDAAGVITSAVVTLTLLDGNGNPIELFPFEDMWLESRDGGMVACDGGTTANFSTDEFGVTEWRIPLQAGGSSLDVAQVMINGDPLSDAIDNLSLHFNSADIDGNGTVNLDDLSAFSTIYYDGNAYDFNIDFEFDGANNLADISMIATAYGSACQ